MVNVSTHTLRRVHSYPPACPLIPSGVSTFALRRVHFCPPACPLLAYSVSVRCQGQELTLTLTPDTDGTRQRKRRGAHQTQSALRRLWARFVRPPIRGSGQIGEASFLGFVDTSYFLLHTLPSFTRFLLSRGPFLGRAQLPRKEAQPRKGPGRTVPKQTPVGAAESQKPRFVNIRQFLPLPPLLFLDRSFHPLCGAPRLSLRRVREGGRGQAAREEQGGIMQECR